MHCYQAYGQTFQINISLNIPSIPQQTTDYKIFVEDGILSDQTITWIHDYDVSAGFPLHRLGKIAQDYVVRFSGYGDFLINEERSLIRCFPFSHARPNTIEHLLLDQIFPRLLDRKMCMALHAGAIVYGYNAIGFVGKTGTGKSTLTAYCGHHGYPVLTDDCLVLNQEQNQFIGFPSYPAIRLHSDSAEYFSDTTDKLPRVAEYSGKLRLNPKHGSYESHKNPERLRALFVLTEPDQNNASDLVSIERCSMREAFGLMIENTFRLDPTDMQSNIREFNNLKVLVAGVPVYRLEYVQKYHSLPDVIRSTLELAT